MNDLKQKIKAIIFDMDGTILNTEALWDLSTKDLLQHHNITNISQEQEEILSKLTGMDAIASARLFKEYFSLPGTLEEIAQLQDAMAMNHLKTGMQFIHGFIAFQKKLVEHGIPHGVATNTRKTPFMFIIEVMKLDNLFGEHLYCVDDVGNRSKPDPALFLFAAEKLGVKPEECLVFEDTVHGFKAAQAAGMKCIAIQNETNKDLLHYVHGSITTYDHAEELLKKL
ncbi:HAD family phosphatase [bacterium]|nr:MAG: HAD family phosphatase [bacterium]